MTPRHAKQDFVTTICHDPLSYMPMRAKLNCCIDDNFRKGFGTILAGMTDYRNGLF